MLSGTADPTYPATAAAIRIPGRQRQGVDLQLRVFLPGEGRPGYHLILSGGPQAQDQDVGGRPPPVHLPQIPGHAAPQQRRQVGDTRHRRPAQEREPPDVYGGGKGCLLGAGLRGAHLPQTRYLSADRGQVFDQGSGLILFKPPLGQERQEQIAPVVAAC